jgi:starch-binding outer membrane protein, SusD/RagB family
MISYRIPRPWSRARRVAAALSLGAALALQACSTTEIVGVETPDIVDPTNVASAAGADAVRVGALTRLNLATSGGPTGVTSPDDSFFMLGGLFADEWNNGDSFIARQEIDRRAITSENSFALAANRVLHRTRVGAEDALRLLTQYAPNTPPWQLAEMNFVQAYAINLLAEHYCDGLVLSSVEDGREEYGHPIPRTEAWERALAQTAEGLARISGTTANDVRVLNALRITRGRILLNLDRIADAAAAVAQVPTNYSYLMRHSANAQTNQIWTYNNNARRYSVSDSEGGNGLNFATAGDPRVPVCRGGTPACTAIGVTQSVRDDLTQPLFVQMIWTTRESPVAILLGVEARLMEAEAALRANDVAQFLNRLNTARATVTGLAALADPGTEAGRVDLLFRERAFWLFSRGTRTGDLRRLVRQYGRPANTVFPTGAWHKAGASYGSDVNFPIPQQEANNPNVPDPASCMNRNP